MSWSNLHEDISARFEQLKDCERHGKLVSSGTFIVSKRALRQHRADKRNPKAESFVKNLETWKRDAEMKMVGRSLPSHEWVRILMDPSNDEEWAAFTDFVYFLRHHHVSHKNIAGMLNRDPVQIQKLLSARVCI